MTRSVSVKRLTTKDKDGSKADGHFHVNRIPFADLMEVAVKKCAKQAVNPE